MRKEDIKIGVWIIWEGDTYPHPRQILRQKGGGYILNIKYASYSVYKERQDIVLESQLLAARLCREDEIPLEFRKELSYEIY